MSNAFELNVFVHARFREVFGPSHKTEGEGEQWALKPPATFMSVIHVFLNGNSGGLGVWIFDPNDHGNTVLNTRITHTGQVDELIKQIHERVKRAARPRGAAPKAA